MSNSQPGHGASQGVPARSRRIVLIAVAVVVAGFLYGIYRMLHFNPNYVEQVDDANRILLRTGGVSLIGVEVLPFEIPGLGRDAHEFVKGLILNRYIRIETDQQEKTEADWTLGYVFIEKDGREIFVNEELLRHGLARLKLVYPNLKYRKRLEAAEAEAKQKRLGFWAPDYKPPHPRSRAGAVPPGGMRPQNPLENAPRALSNGVPEGGPAL